MKISILTTDTIHHSFFVRELMACYGDVMVFCQSTTAVKPLFQTYNNFESERDRYESKSWFGDSPIKISDIAPIQFYPSLNCDTAVKSLRDYNADIIIVFGTDVLQPAVISVNPSRIFNLHGGDPEFYRGLDTHLWAIYHNDFNNLITTLHRLDARLDNGDIVVQCKIPISKGMPIYALRRANTEVCVTLSMSVIDMIQRNGDVISRAQRTKGRYYSSMPTELKNICQRQFESYTAKLDNASR